MSVPLERLQGKYEILEKLKEGGMGAIYKVRHRLLEELRVIKLMRPQLERDESLEARFLREAKTAIKLRHHSIAQLYDFSMDDDGNAFIVMEFIDGITLQELLARAEPGLGLVLEIACQSLDALAYLHRKKIVHRDVSPDNLMLTRDDDGRPLIKLIDLGIAKSLGGGGGDLTTTGLFLGKVRYCSPEQLRREEGAPVDYRSDLYSFGVVLYELLTGRHPIIGESLTALIAGHLIHPPLSFSDSDPKNRVPDDLREIVLRALSKDPDHRQPDALSFVADLEAVKTRFPYGAEEVAWALSQAEPPTTAIRISPPGSTQDRLDVQFGPSETPSPATVAPELAPTPLERPTARPARTAAPPPLPPHPEVESLLEEASSLLDEGRPGEALARASRVAELAPDDARVQDLLERAEAERERHEQAAREAAIVRTLEALGAKLDAGDLAGAREDVEQAHSALGERSDFACLRDRLEALELEEAVRQAEALRAEAQSLAAEEDFSGARQRLRAAMEIHPDHDAVRADMGRLEEAEKAYQARLAHQREVEAAARGVRGAIQSGDLDAADEALRSSLADLGSCEVFAALEQEILQLRQEARERELAALLRAARLAAERSRFEEAIEALERAATMCPEDTMVRRVLARTREDQARFEEEQRKARAQAEAVEEIEHLARAARFEEALERLEAATSVFGDSDVLRLQHSRVTAAHAAQRAHDAFEAAVDRAEALLESEAWAELLEALPDDAAAAGDDAELADRAAELRRQASDALARARREQEERAAVSRVEACIRSGDLEQARRALGMARKLGASSEALDTLARRLEEAEEDRQLAEVADLVGRAREAADSGLLEKAARILKDGEGRFPGNPEIAHYLDTIRRREAEAAIQSSLETGDLKAAERGLKLAEKLYGDDERFLRLRDALTRMAADTKPD